MALTQMPNGEYVDIADGTSPDVIAKIKSQFPATRMQRVASGQPRSTTPAPSAYQQQINRRADIREKTDPTGSDFQRSVMKGLTGNFMDEIAGGINALTSGTYNAIKNRNLGEFGNAYRVGRDTERELDRRAQERSPVQSVAGEIGGSIMMPTGVGSAALKGAGALAGKAGLSKAAAALTNLGARAANASPVAGAIMEGAGQGALNAAGNANNISDVPDALFNGGLVGGVTGGVAGAATQGLRRVSQVVRDRMAPNAERTAYSKIASRLENANMSPEDAAKYVREANAAGNDMRTMDILPSTRADAAYYSRLPDNKGSNELQDLGADRMANRANRFTEAVEGSSGVPATGTSTSDLIEAIKGKRSAQGEADYIKGGIMDRQLAWTPELENFFKNEPDADQLIKSAYKNAMRWGDDLGVVNPAGNGEMQAIPSMRVFDYLKRAYDDAIGSAMKAGRNTEAGGLSASLGRLKELLGDANPDYAPILARQHDLFQQQKAAELGEKLLALEPRQALKQIKGFDANTSDDARTGILSYLVSLDAKANPVGILNGMLRNDKKRQVLEFAFGGKDKLSTFETWLKNEAKSARTDQLVSGPQSVTSAVQLAGHSEAGEIGGVVNNALRGLAFGGPVGLASGAIRGFDKLSSGMSKHAQEAYSRILAGDAQDLEKGVAGVKAYREGRVARNRRAARLAGKAGQQMFTDSLGSN